MPASGHVTDRGSASAQVAARSISGGVARPLHLGVILPNYGVGASPEAIRRMAAAADSYGFDSVWATEHVIVGPAGASAYGLVYAPFVTLSWIAGWTERVELGTSILILPLHSPMRVAKEVATLCELTGRRVRVGVGAGWHEDEFGFMGVDFRSRGRRTDEAIRVIRALWAGADAFEGEFWQFADATFGPLPALEPEIWIGGVKRSAVRRTLALGDVWHPSSNVDLGFVADVMSEHPDLRLVPRTPPERVDDYLALGAEGVAVAFPDETSMRSFARQYR
jgi:probable F420-dependent oxidoreductase